MDEFDECDNDKEAQPSVESGLPLPPNLDFYTFLSPKTETQYWQYIENSSKINICNSDDSEYPATLSSNEVGQNLRNILGTAGCNNWESSRAVDTPNTFRDGFDSYGIGIVPDAVHNPEQEDTRPSESKPGPGPETGSIEKIDSVLLTSNSNPMQVQNMTYVSMAEQNPNLNPICTLEALPFTITEAELAQILQTSESQDFMYQDQDYFFSIDGSAQPSDIFGINESVKPFALSSSSGTGTANMNASSSPAETITSPQTTGNGNTETAANVIHSSSVSTSEVSQLAEMPLQPEAPDADTVAVKEKEPFYVNVNPKQYHRILKRREARARLEARGRIPKEGQKHIYESRHKHALKTILGKREPFHSSPGGPDCTSEDGDGDWPQRRTGTVLVLKARAKKSGLNRLRNIHTMQKQRGPARSRILPHHQVDHLGQSAPGDGGIIDSSNQ